MFVRSICRRRPLLRFVRSGQPLKRLAVAALAVVIASSARGQTLLVDTGQGNASGGHALFNSPPNFNFLGCKFTQASAFTIGTVQGWMVRPSERSC